MKNSRPSLKVKEKNEDSSLRRQLSKATLLAALLAASTQLTKHWWPKEALIYGMRVDYLAPSLSLLDAIILLHLILARKWKHAVKLTPVLLLAAATMLTTGNHLATLTYAARLLIYALFALTLNVEKNKKLITYALIIGVLGQTTLAIAQTAKGASVGGLAYLVGERTLTTGTPNVAKAEMFGRTVLRAYGTFSHPNTLAGWLIAALFILNALIKDKKKNLLSIALGIPAIILTQSRAALTVLVSICIPTAITKSQRNAYALALAGIMAVFVMTTGPEMGRNKEAITDRLKLQNISYAIIKENPLFGAGLNNALSRYPEVDEHNRLLQPDHNSATLLISQLGLMGIVTLALFWKRLPKPTPRAVWIFVPLLLIDHYFFTSPQALLIALIAWRVDAGTR